MSNQLCPDWKLYSYGIDYLTATTPVENGDAFDIAIAAYCQQEGLSKITDGAEAKQRDFVGVKWGKCFVGRNKTHAIINISSFVSWDLFLSVAERPLVKLTRLDLQMTGYETLHKADLGDYVHNELLARQEREELDERLQIDSRTNRGKRNTVYIGSDESDKRLRIYNKTFQAKLDTGSEVFWRWEMQLRNEIANHCGRTLAGSPATPQNVLRYLVGYLDGWNIVIHDSFQGERLRYVEVAKDDKLAKKFNWIESQVIPTLEALLESEAYSAPTLQLLGAVLERYWEREGY